MTKPSAQGTRYNAGKAPISLVLEARDAVNGMANVLGFGLIKYGRGNWFKGLPVTEVADSLARHLAAYLSGEDNDPETGLPHVDHIAVNALFISQLSRRPECDDRTHLREPPCKKPPVKHPPKKAARR